MYRINKSLEITENSTNTDECVDSKDEHEDLEQERLSVREREKGILLLLRQSSPYIKNGFT